MKKIKFTLNRNHIFTIVINIVLITIISWGIHCVFSPKIGHVRTNVLIQNYIGMKEAQKELDKKKEQWQKNLDSLAIQHDQRVMTLGNRKPNSDEEEILTKSIEQYNEYTSRINKLSQDEEIKLMSGVVNQITSQINEYAKENHYDYILGTTDQGSLLFGKEKNDITEDLLKYLNNKYEK